MNPRKHAISLHVELAMSVGAIRELKVSFVIITEGGRIPRAAKYLAQSVFVNPRFHCTASSTVLLQKMPENIADQRFATEIRAGVTINHLWTSGHPLVATRSRDSRYNTFPEQSSVDFLELRSPRWRVVHNMQRSPRGALCPMCAPCGAMSATRASLHVVRWPKRLPRCRATYIISMVCGFFNKILYP